jgi:hypothetical protein
MYIEKVRIRCRLLNSIYMLWKLCLKKRGNRRRWTQHLSNFARFHPSKNMCAERCVIFSTWNTRKLQLVSFFDHVASTWYSHMSIISIKTNLRNRQLLDTTPANFYCQKHLKNYAIISSSSHKTWTLTVCTFKIAKERQMPSTRRQCVDAALWRRFSRHWNRNLKIPTNCFYQQKIQWDKQRTRSTCEK